MGRIKICGIRREADVDFINEAKPDYAGFVFAPGKRQVDLETASRLRSKLCAEIVPVGVFVDAKQQDVEYIFSRGIIEIAQLHGSEDFSYIGSLISAGIPVIKTIKINGDMSAADIIKICERYNNANYLLLDSGAGSGKTFDWSLLDNIKLDKPWFLAGGIDAQNINTALAKKPFAIDASSGTETDGVKDREKILSLVSCARQGGLFLEGLFKNALILAGGRGTRIGYDKKELVLGGEKIIYKLISLLQREFDFVYVSSNTEFKHSGISVVRDILGAGPLAGIYSALSGISCETQEKDGYLYVTACDMPFISSAHINKLKAAALESRRKNGILPDVIAVKRPDGFIEPFNALYHVKTAPVIKERLERGEYKAGLLFPLLNVHPVNQFDKDEFFNINTGSDLQAAVRQLHPQILPKFFA